MASLLYAGSAAVNVPGGLAAAPLATPAPGNENRRFAVPSAFSLRLSGRARSYIPVGHALSAHPCASPRPAVNASAIFCRTGPLPPATLRPDRGTGVDSPLKSANRRPDDKGWTPWMAARGEARQGRRVEPTAGRKSGGERSAKHRFRCGAVGKGIRPQKPTSVCNRRTAAHRAGGYADSMYGAPANRRAEQRCGKGGYRCHQKASGP